MVNFPDLAAHALMAGVPAKQIGWMSRFGERIPLTSDGEYQCPYFEDVYKLENGIMQLEIIKEN